MNDDVKTIVDDMKETVVAPAVDPRIHSRVTTPGGEKSTLVEPSGHVSFPPVDAPDERALLGPSALIGGRWRLSKPIQAGGIASIWEAHDMKGQAFGRRAALKIALHSHDPAVVEQRNDLLREEARILTRLGHCHNIVRFIEDDITADGRVVLVLEHLDGHTLAQVCEAAAGRRLTVHDTLKYIIQVVWALRVVHGDNVLHRDLTPSNIFIHNSDSEGPMAKLIDFNIAKRLTTGALARTSVGTPGYMAPEVEGTSLAPRVASTKSDQWTLAATAAECISGARYTGSDQRAALMAAGKVAPLEVLQQAAPPDAPPGLLEVLARALAEDPNARYPNITAFGVALLPFADVDTQRRWHKSLTSAPVPIAPAVSASILARPELQQRFLEATQSPPSDRPPPPPPSPIRTERVSSAKTRALLVLTGATAVFLLSGGVIAWRRHSVVRLPPPAWITSAGPATAPTPTTPASSAPASTAAPPRPVPPALVGPPPSPEPAPASEQDRGRPARATAPTPSQPARRIHRERVKHPSPASAEPLVDEKGFPILPP